MEKGIQQQKRILLVDDDELLLRSLARVLECYPGIEIVGKASSGEESLGLIREKNPKVVIMDVKMPGMGGIEATRQIRAEFPDTVVLGLSAHEDRASIVGIIQAGAAGYVLKPIQGQELVNAIEEVVAGKTYFSKGTFGAVAEGLRNPEHRDPALIASLTERETEVLRLVAMGHSSKEISEKLALTMRTIAFYREEISRKVGIHGAAEFTKIAIKAGLIPAR